LRSSVPILSKIPRSQPTGPGPEEVPPRRRKRSRPLEQRLRQLEQNTALLRDLAVSFNEMKNEGALKIGNAVSSVAYQRVRFHRTTKNSEWRNALTKVMALERWILEWMARFTPCAIPSKTFICLPFTGGISAYAVILPRPQDKL
jgi:hypothetical protein